MYLDMLGTHSQMQDLFLKDSGDTFNRLVSLVHKLPVLVASLRQRSPFF